MHDPMPLLLFHDPADPCSFTLGWRPKETCMWTGCSRETTGLEEVFDNVWVSKIEAKQDFEFAAERVLEELNKSM